MLIGQAGKMTVDGEMAVDSVRPQIADQFTETVDVELEDEREADDDRRLPLYDFQDRAVILLEIDDSHLPALAPKRGGEVAEAQILLFLESDQHDAAGPLDM